MLDFNSLLVGQYLLIQTDDWFIAPDGKKYNAVWGKCKVLEARDILGLEPSGSSNWYIQVGSGEQTMIISGCKVNYAHVCLEKPNDHINTYINCP